MNECEARKCPFWNGKMCIDSEEYVDSKTGEICCRYCTNAVRVEGADLAGESIKRKNEKNKM